MIQDLEVHRSSTLGSGLVALALALALAGCSHNAAEPATPGARAAEPAPASNPDDEVLAVDNAPEPPPPALSRPRLSRTITLGETQYQPLPDAPPPGPGGVGGATVVVNNYVMTPPAYGGYYGGYSYGGYGYGSGYGYGGGYAPRAAFVARAPGTGRWGATGWEGAGRTAAPGHVPAVGGNWSSPPSSGPRQLK